MNRPRLVVPAIILIVAAAGGLYWASRPAPDGAGPITLNGTVDIRQVDLSFRVEGKLARLAVEEGDRVVTGQMVAELDRGYLDDARRVAEARVAAQTAQLAKLERGNRPQEIAQARAEAERTQAALVNARATHDRIAALPLDRVASRQSLDDARGALRQAEAQAARAAQALDLARSGSREEDISIARAQLAGEQATLDLMNRRLADAVLTAPGDGIIMTRVREPGSNLMPGATVATLALSQPMQVRAWVAETQLDRAVPGTKVEIHTDAAGAKALYHGQIGFVSPVAEFTPKSVETPELRTSLVYRLRIIVGDADDGLRQGMPVTVVLPAKTMPQAR